jgi:hypothetical protein
MWSYEQVPAAILHFNWDPAVLADIQASGTSMQSNYLKPELLTTPKAWIMTNRYLYWTNNFSNNVISSCFANERLRFVSQSKRTNFALETWRDGVYVFPIIWWYFSAAWKSDNLNFSSIFSHFFIFEKVAKIGKKVRIYIALTFRQFSATFFIFEKVAKIGKK